MADRLQELLRMMREAGMDDSDSEDSSSSPGPRASRSSSSSSSSSNTRPTIVKNFSDLRKALDCFLEQPERPFRPGDIVVWKEGCSNRKRPKTGEPAVVVEVLPKPLYGEEKSTGSPYFHEPLDIVLGMLDDDGDFVRYCYDRRRFRLAVQPDEISGSSSSEKLRNLAIEFNKPLELCTGDAIMLKPGLRNRRVPDYSTVCVVADVLKEPFRDVNAEEGTPGFYELINGRIAFLDGDGDLAFLYVDLRRFRKVK